MADYDPFDTEAIVERAETRQRREAASRAAFEEDIAWMMSGPRGRRIVSQLFALTGVDAQTFHPNALEMARIAGRQELGRYLRAIIDRVCPEHLVDMRKEQQDVRARNSQAS